MKRPLLLAACVLSPLTSAHSAPPAEVPTAEVPTAEVPRAVDPIQAAAQAKVAGLRKHLAALVNARADRLGGPRYDDQDARLQILKATVRIAEAQPGLPIPRHVSTAKTLEALWGASTASFTHELMVKTTALRPGAEKPGQTICEAACGRLAEVSGRDTATGVEEHGWPMDNASKAAIMEGARFALPMCVSHCVTEGMHNPACVMELTRQDGLNVCWSAPEAEEKKEAGPAEKGPAEKKAAAPAPK